MARPETEKRWTEIIDQHEASGLSIRAFAQRKGVNPSTLAWWRSRLGRAVSRGKRKSKVFQELTVRGEPGDKQVITETTVVVALDDLAAHVVVDGQTDLTLLKRVLVALC